MGRVLSNEISLLTAIETAGTPGALPPSPVWFELEPNTLGDFGATITTVARDPISPNRQRRKGTTTDLDSTANWEGDLTISHLEIFLEGFVFAEATNADNNRVISAVSGNTFTVDSGETVPTGRLVFSRGLNLAVNNGIHAVTGATSTTVVVDTTLSTETVPAVNQLSVCGVRGATGDLGIDGDGNLTSTTLDFTTLGLTNGSAIFIGGADAANQFATAANRGYARVIGVATNLLTLDKRATTFVADNGAGQAVDIFFGQFYRNVRTNNAAFLERSYQFETSFPNLANPSGDEYEYSLGNYCNTLGVNLPLTDKATMSFGFIGTDTETPTGTRKTNAATAQRPLKTAAFNTTADCARLRITNVDESGLTTDFKNLTLTFGNNVTPEKVLCNLGARFINFGNFNIDMEAQLLFTDSAVVAAIRNNTTVTMDFALRNSDGAVFFDIPSATIGGGGKEFPVNESVLINTTVQAFADTVLDTSIGITIFAFVPDIL